MNRTFSTFLAVLVALVCVPAAAAQDTYVTRSQLLMLTLDAQESTRALVDHYRSNRSTLPLFRDVDQASVEAPYVEAAFSLGLIRGYEDRTLRLEEVVALEEATAVLLIASGRTIRQGIDGPWYEPVFREAMAINAFAHPQSVQAGSPITVAQFTDMERRIGLIPSPVPVAAAPASAVQAVTSAESVQDESLQESEEPLSDSRERIVAHPVTDGSTLQAYASGLDFGITIPSLGIHNLPVFHPDDPSTNEGVLSVLGRGLGHLFSYPGRGGKIMVYGHSSSYAWDLSEYTKIFRQINKLQAGDQIYLMYQGNLYQYQVTMQERVAPDDSSPFHGSGEELLLYTCWPPDSTKSRLVIHASPVQTVAVR